MEKQRVSKQIKQMQTLVVEPTSLFYRIIPQLNIIAPSQANDEAFLVLKNGTWCNSEAILEKTNPV